ncbi:MAG: hypothetical protein AB1589_17255 [Cyanobacteriota bacterium]
MRSQPEVCPFALEAWSLERETSTFLLGNRAQNPHHALSVRSLSNSQQSQAT